MLDQREHMSPPIRLSCASIVLACLCGTADADIILTITGEASDSIVQWEIDGAVTVNSATSSSNTPYARFPTADTAFWNLNASLGTDGITSSVSGLSWTGDFRMSVNGGPDVRTGNPSQVRINHFATHDTIWFEHDTNALLPSLSIGDSVAYAGSGTINLGAATKATYFQNGVFVGGALDHASDTMRLIVQDSVASVPEPSSFAVVGIGLLLSIGYRFGIRTVRPSAASEKHRTPVDPNSTRVKLMANLICSMIRPIVPIRR